MIGRVRVAFPLLFMKLPAGIWQNFGSEITGGAQAKAVEPTITNALRSISIGQEAIPLDLHVRVQKPVHAECQVGNLAAINGFVDQIKVAHSNASLPGPA